MNQSGNSGFGGGKGGFGSKGGKGFGGFGGGFKVPQQQQQQQVIIEDEVLKREKLFDFDGRLVDASMGQKYAKDFRKTIMAVVVIIIAFIFGCGIGYLWSGVLSARKSVTDRIEVANTIDSTIRTHVDSFQQYAQLYRQRSEFLGAGVLEYDEKFFNDVIRKYKDANFMVDVSTIPPEAISMASNGLQNPLSDIRGYAAGTMALGRILDSHIEQTLQDLDEINTLLGKNSDSATDRNIVYALEIDPVKMMSIVDTDPNLDEKKAGYPKADRKVEAMRSTSSYVVKRAITDDEEAAQIYAKMKAEGIATDARDFKQLSEKEIRERHLIPSEPVPEGLVVPNHLLYVVTDKAGKEKVFFADQIILLDRTKLYAASPNALERYRKRMMQIMAILGDIEKSTDTLIGKIHAIATEDPL